jgi:N-terminal acetyltransferase B complex non-catalytic subunit
MQGSDLDEIVEDKLLIGDRPRQSNDPDNKIPLQERLVQKRDGEEVQVGPYDKSCETKP